ncbi:MAG TPA: hypothetical protein VF921_16910 [Vicinamibacterales bacterium]
MRLHLRIALEGERKLPRAQSEAAQAPMTRRTSCPVPIVTSAAA